MSKKPTITSLKRENAKLRKRLEMTHVWQLINGKMIRRRVARGRFLSGPAIYDGIDCRNETIRQQDRYIAELQLRLITLEQRLSQIGFDPRDGSSGKPELEHIPNAKTKAALVEAELQAGKITVNQARKKLGLKPITGPARIRSKKPSSWPPSARPPKGSP